MNRWLLLTILGLVVSPILGQAQENRTFPDYFKFGVATAAFQVEGGWNADGKSENIWDHLCHTDPSFMWDGICGDVACDSYHKYREDVQNIKALGADFYRLSLSWSRLIPHAIAGSPINEAGAAYYRNLIDDLIDNGIEPVVTIFHWDLPQVLQDLGGWPNHDIVEHYAYYARTVFDLYGDSVKLWFTFNEPMQICEQGYGRGTMAPAINSAGLSDYQCSYSLLKAHALAYHIYDEEFRDSQGGRVGIVIDTAWFEPETDSDEDQDASERSLQFYFGWFANPVYRGDYPQVLKDRVAYRSRQEGFATSRLPAFTDEEVTYINATFDFLALNTYSTQIARATEEAPFDQISYDNDRNAYVYYREEWEEGASNWLRVVPWGIRKLLNWLKNTYGNPEILITENGFSDDGQLDDPRRINYYNQYLSNVLQAVLDDGVNVTHYTAWSLMDNMEWDRGFTEKFGLYNVNFDDPERTRTPKKSAAYYSHIATTHCLNVDGCDE